MNKKITILTIILSVLLTTGIVAVSSFAASGNVQNKGGFSGDRQAAIEKALESNDYQAWKNLMGDRRITQYINESNFTKFAEAHKLTKVGKLDEAKVLREERSERLFQFLEGTIMRSP